MKAFSFGAGEASAGAADEELPALAQPASAEAAVSALLRADVEGRPEDGWPLLDSAARARFPTPSAWARFRASRPVPTGFEIVATTPAASAIDVTAKVAAVPSLDPFAGLVAAETEVVWRAHREDNVWRVAAEPEASRLVLPGDETAPATVRNWVAAVAACDTPTARTFQAGEALYGPADLTTAPCRLPGDWTVTGAAAPLATSPDTATLQAAFGAGVVSWGRIVPVRGPAGTGFLAALAPFGDGWRVMGVTASL